MWVANVVDTPAEKRAVAIALVNALGNSSSIYGVFLWPDKDAPRYIPGFSATTCWMGLIAIIAPIAGWQFEKRNTSVADADRVVAAETEMQRKRGSDTRKSPV
jgi:hypothetical protein